MVGENESIVARAETAWIGAGADEPTISMRNYFSTYFLISAQSSARRAATIEDEHSGASRFDMEHRGLVLESVVAAASFLEAMVNELFQDAHDKEGTSGDGYVAPLTDRSRRLMAEWWAETNQGFKPALVKYQRLLQFSVRPEMKKGSEPYQSADLLINLRNTLVHYKSESVPAAGEHPLESRLHGRFPDNRLMTSSGNPWWPDHALGAGCARWAGKSAKNLADSVIQDLQIKPNYQQHEPEWIHSYS